MITIETFYKGYQMRHHKAKAYTLLTLLENKDFLKAEDIIDPIFVFTQAD